MVRSRMGVHSTAHVYFRETQVNGGLMSARRLLLATAFLVLAATAASAQGRTGTITGVVTGDDGNRLPGVIVTIENAAGSVKRTATTDPDGRYELADVPAGGEYVVGAALVGFGVATPMKVTFGDDRRATVNFVLKVTLLESVAVTARSPLLEEDQS